METEVERQWRAGGNGGGVHVQVSVCKIKMG